MTNQVIQTKPVPYCPQCGAKMVLRRPKPDTGQTWKPFWGCGQFPDCKGKRGIDDHGKPIFDEIVNS